MPLGYGSSLTTFLPKGQLRLRGSSMQRGCLSIGARRHNNAIRETRLCLCKTEPPSGAKRGNPLSPEHRFLTVFRKISMPNSLALRRDHRKKPKDQKLASRPKGRSSHENGLRLRATATPSPPFAKRRLGLRGSSLQRGCLSIGARHHYNAIRETRLCLCKSRASLGG